MSAPDATIPSEAEDLDRRPGRVSRTSLIVGVVVALAVGGLVGAALGWKFEQNRVKDDAQNVRPFGLVTAVDANSVTVRLQTGAGGSRTYTLTGNTTVDRAEAGTSGDIVKGATVLVRTGSGGKSEAAEVVVLPDSTTFGKRGKR